MKKFCVLIFFTIISLQAWSFTIPYGDKLTGLLGESILHPDIHAWMVEMRSENTIEKLEPNMDLFSIEFRDQGVALDFTVNFHLKGIRLFDSGKVYSEYPLPLPGNLKFEMDIESLLSHSKSYAWDENNPYEVVATYNDMKVIVYMRSNKIEMVHLKPDFELVRKKELASITERKFRMLPDGECLSQNCYDSIGTMDWGNVIKYSGEWANGFPNGGGVYLDTHGHAYNGQFLMGFFWGKGIYKDVSNHEYNGEFVMGTKTGTGTAIYKNGFKYTGEWLNDLFHGDGTYYQQTGYIFEGEFYKGAFNGEGKMTTPYGYYSGSFKNGKPDGKGEQYSNNTRNTLKGIWVNGSKEGEFEFSSPNGNSSKIYFENDQQVPH